MKEVFDKLIDEAIAFFEGNIFDPDDGVDNVVTMEYAAHTVVEKRFGELGEHMSDAERIAVAYYCFRKDLTEYNSLSDMLDALSYPTNWNELVFLCLIAKILDEAKIKASTLGIDINR